MLGNLLKSRLGGIVISVLWGFGLALIFQRSCRGGRCVVIEGPPIETVVKTTYEFDGHGCYTFAPKLVECGPDLHPRRNADFQM